jgi:O-antigen/teichoic acid export membrane protein
MKPSRTLGVALLSIGRVSVSLSNIILAAILARQLDKHSYGLFRIALFVIIVVGPLFRFGVGESIVYYLPREPRRTRTIVTAALALIWLGSAIWGAMLLFGGAEWIARLIGQPDVAGPMFWLVLYGFAAFPNVIVVNCLTALKQINWIVPYTILARLTVVASAITAVAFVATVEAAIVGNLIGECITLVFGLTLIYRACTEWDGWPRAEEYSRQLRLGIPLLLANFVMLLNHYADNFLVARYFTAEDVAVYSNGAFQLPIVALVLRSATLILLPDMTRLVSDDDDRGAIDLFRRAAQKSALPIMGMFAFCLFFADDMMVAIYGTPYLASAVPFRIYLLALPATVVHFQPAFFAKKRGGELLVRSCGLLAVNVAVSVPMLFWLGPNGAAWGTVAATYGFDMLLTTWRVGRLYRQRPIDVLPWKTILIETAGSLALAAVAWAICAAVPWSNAWIRLPIGAAIFCTSWAVWRRDFLLSLPILSRFAPRKN